MSEENEIQETSAAPDLSAFLQQAQLLQDQLVNARESTAEQTIEGVAADGAVTVSVTGAMDFQKVHIDPSLVDDVSLLEDLLLAALRDALSKVDALNQEAMGTIFGS